MIHRIARAALAATLFASAAGAAGTLSAPSRFGAAVRVKQPVDVAQLAATPEKFKGRTVRLEGTVKDVCQGKGCWVQVADASGASFMARSVDESVLLPKNCKGWHVVVQGKVMALPARVANEPAPRDHACPKPEYIVSTSGVELTPGPMDAPLQSRTR